LAEGHLVFKTVQELDNTFTETAWDEYVERQSENKRIAKLAKRISDLIKDIQRNGFLRG
jgi:Txe/YoeB family toxin of Txe-Axe toxin-antitoxin module